MGLWRDRPSRTANFDRNRLHLPALPLPREWFLLDFVGSAISLRGEISVIYPRMTRVEERERERDSVARFFNLTRIASLHSLYQFLYTAIRACRARL